MAIDVRHNKDRKVRRTEPKSQDIYLRLLVKLYRYKKKISCSPLRPNSGRSYFLPTFFQVPCQKD